MKRLFYKIPTFIWTAIVVFLIGLFIFKSSIGTDTAEKLKILGGLVSVIGLFFVALQMQLQKRNNIITTEFLNQPNFDFLEFGDKAKSEKGIIDSSPKLCSPRELNAINYNECTDIHWFNIRQTGKLPAKEIKISLICKDEKENILSVLEKRTQSVPMLYNNDVYQFKLPEHAISLDHYKTKKNGQFFILIEYLSTYSNIKYKRVYELNYSPLLAPDAIPTTWVQSIRYFGFNLTCLTDSRTLTVKQIRKNIWNKLSIKLYFKKTMSIDEWTIDI